VEGDLEERWGEVNGIVHAVAFSPEDALGGNFQAWCGTGGATFGAATCATAASRRGQASARVA
jgi:enoyl-[acyl-carrier-protein] reductase (NADH)